MPGCAGQRLFGTPDARHVLVGDGWGVSYRSLALRRLSLVDGSEEAVGRLGNQVRAVDFSADGSRLLAAIDTRLFELDAATLELVRRWDRRVPRYTDALVWLGETVLLKCAGTPTFALMDLASGRVRRRRVGTGGWLVRAGDTVFILSSDEERGAVHAVRAADLRPTPVLETPPFIDAALDRSRRRLWMSLGVRVHHEEFRFRPGRPARVLRAYDIDTGEHLDRELDFHFGELALGPDELWLTRIDRGGPGRSLDYSGFHGLPSAVERLGLDDDSARPAIRAPRRNGKGDEYIVAAMLPAAGVAFATRSEPDAAHAELLCLTP